MATHTPQPTPLDVDPSSLPLSLATCSIGLPRHTLHQKLEAISHAGFGGIELSLPDLVTHAEELVRLGRIKQGDTTTTSSSSDKDKDKTVRVAQDDWPALREAATSAAHLCATHNLRIILLQPFANLEGWPRGSPQRDAAFARARGWLGIMEAAGCDTLQVGSTDAAAPSTTADRGLLAADLAELADLLRPAGRRVAYENWCWATRAPGWRDAWELVRLAGRDNVGLCLDTFQSAGGEWGDPTAASGRRLGGDEVGEGDAEAAWQAGLRELAATVPADKIYLLQVSDAYRADPPLSPDDDDDDDNKTGLRPRARWSHDCRPLPYDDGGYLPVADFTRAVLGTGFRGWLSVEVFDGRFGEKYGDDLRGSSSPAGRPGQPCSMQAQRLQRIRGNYQGETRALPSGQDWPRSHSAVEERDEVVQARASIPQETGGGS
ncbi:hypothetical protein KVR01_010288 [Diaporthe batatas]|uniref:uncharacterized protein n=1 Tax=Diaporthe batatas TaxID=748121 RepID=UPI001D03626D|nr:uncharacterized protein KVR01_010288 [Diaporthe batatas]KAG8159651.1 hypothetical protein KVR01_010288 [Diaporthe batatas]